MGRLALEIINHTGAAHTRLAGGFYVNVCRFESFDNCLPLSNIDRQTGTQKLNGEITII